MSDNNNETAGALRLPQLTRVPGEIKQQREHSLNKDLSKLSRRDLLDLRNRQLKLLENKSWLKRLPDKGEKIQNLYDRVAEALEHRASMDDAAKLFTSLNIASSQLNNLEWEGSTQPKQQQDTLDSDDEEQDPLEILASSNSVFQNQKIIKNSNDPNERPLVTEQDIQEAKEIEQHHHQLDPVDELICQREKLEPEHRFLPHKSTENKRRDDGGAETASVKEKKVRDITAASPPVLKQGAVALTLRESIEVEFQHQTHMKSLMEKQAAERLHAKMRELKASGVKMSAPPKVLPRNATDMSKYRIAPPIIDDEGLLGGDDDEDKSDDTLSDDEEY